MRHTLYCFIKSLLISCIFVSAAVAQTDSIPDNPKQTDSVTFKQKYGLRIGGDISKLARSFIDDNYKGFEINGDYRLTKKWYIAGEIGTEEKTTDAEFLNATTQGTYFKVGADYNAYQNWYGMENMIYGGLRVGVSSFSQTLNSYGVYSDNQYWSPQFTTSDAIEQKGLSAIWAEVIVGLKVEVLNNLYLGANMQFKYIASQDQPNNFENLYIPGYNKTYDSGNFGFGYGYNISYLIPLFKKAK